MGEPGKKVVVKNSYYRLAKMSDSKMNFEQAADKVKKLKKTPSTQQQLALYGLYKQGNVGDINISQPWAVQVEARSKWDAWNSHKGKSKADAQAAYVTLVESYVKEFGLSE